MFDTKVGVIGTGSMGRNHVRVFSEIADLVGVCDIDTKATREISKKFGCMAFSKVDKFLQETGVEVVTVSTPTTTHKEIVLKCLRAGVDVLVEKPISDTVENAQEILDEANSNGRVFGVGMIERHNPVVQFTRELIEKGELGQLVTMMSRRVSNYPRRIKDVGVVTDLGVHDIDVLRYLCDCKVISVYALGGNIKDSKHEDHATILMMFENGVEGVVEASWLTPMKLRKITLTGVEGVAEMDYMDQNVSISTSSTFNKDKFDLWRLPQIYDTRRIRVKNEEPLKRELEDFLRSAKERRDPMVTGHDGLRTLMIAKAAEESIRTGKKVDIQ
ncbi:MAG: Gfo/Idh/MocA family oxidoreductase [Thermoplasmatota archaeon]